MVEKGNSSISVGNPGLLPYVSGGKLVTLVGFMALHCWPVLGTEISVFLMEIEKLLKLMTNLIRGL